jgi:hypothetical protein
LFIYIYFYYLFNSIPLFALLAKKYIDTLKILPEFYLDYITHILPQTSYFFFFFDLFSLFFFLLSTAQIILDCVDELQRILQYVETITSKILLKTSFVSLDRGSKSAIGIPVRYELQSMLLLLLVFF